jgi:hypothetical protein
VSTIRATWRNGQIIPDVPVDWPEGCRLIVERASAGDGDAAQEDWHNTPEAIAEWLTWYDSLEPLVFTPEEEADIAAWRQKIKEHTTATMHRSIDGLFE